MKIYPVILCGGSGTRLWPLSRASFPKQFSKLVGEFTLFQDSVQRLAGAEFADPIIVTGERFRFIVLEQLDQIGRKPAAVLVEPEGRNTAPAVLAATMWLRQHDPDAAILVAPSDHCIPDHAAFRSAVLAAAPVVADGNLLTFGIQPTRPETGYGYLALHADVKSKVDSPQKLDAFVEKPELERAREMVASGRHLWNAGIFLMSVEATIAGFERHASDLLDPVQKALEGAQFDLGFTRLSAEDWREARGVSIDYAIMEHADNLWAMPYTGEWSDLGDWSAVWQQGEQDADGNVCSAHATAIECKNSLLRSEDPNLEVVGIGLDDVIAVAMPDAVLVASRARSQAVKEAVVRLSTRQATEFPREHRPWGWYEPLAQGARFQVKRIVVHPGASLSLQSHHHRAEHWVVVQGTAKVTLGEEVRLLTENQSVYVPLGTVHRLENPGKIDVVLVEVQTGPYLGEDDIIRYIDSYARI